jgi:Flp pilus assembly protein TadD
MAVCELFGSNPGAHHVANLVIHVATVVILFRALWLMTGAAGPSWMTAVLFAIHPLHVESVAWVAERKGLLSSFFWMLTLLAYAHYVRQRCWQRLVAVVVAFLLGLMCKQMGVTLPFALLLLDFWPLRRQLSFHLLIEKIPLFALTVAFSIVGYSAQHSGGTLPTLEQCPLGMRLGNAAVSYVVYFGRVLWPAGLSIWYPYQGALYSFWQIGAACVLLLAISAVAISTVKTFPEIFVGWFWYLGTALPIIGLVQIGRHSGADHYTDIPVLGIFLGLSFFLRAAAERLSWPSGLVVAPAVLLTAVMAALSSRQLVHWRDNVAAYTHAIAVTRDNYLAHNNLAIALADLGQWEPALFHMYQTLRIRHHLPEAHNDLGLMLARLGRRAEAIAHFEESIRQDPTIPQVYDNLGTVLADEGRLEEAADTLQRALALDPDRHGTHRNLGIVRGMQNDWTGAERHYRRALELQPDDTAALVGLGRVSEALDDDVAAAAHYRQALAVRPGDAAALVRLAWLLATSAAASVHDGAGAIRTAEQAVAVTARSSPGALDALAAAYAAAGQFDDACKTIAAAIALTEAAQQPTLAANLQEKLARYQQHQPPQRPATTNPPQAPKPEPEH